MTEKSTFLAGCNEKIEVIKMFAKNRTITLPTDIIGAVLFMVLAFALLLITPKQVVITEGDLISGRMFPTMLIWLMVICCTILLAQNIKKIVNKEPIRTVTLNLLTELKAITIFLILLGTYFISRITDLFVVGAVFCCLGFLTYYGCKKKSYYGITILSAVVIWAAFRFALGIRF